MTEAFLNGDSGVISLGASEDLNRYHGLYDPILASM